jgi:hypothetical protein
MRVIWNLILVLALATPFAFADQPAAIQLDQRRPSTDSLGLQWHDQDSVDNMTGERTILTIAEANGFAKNVLGQNTKASLMIGCTGRKMTLGVFVEDAFINRDDVVVLIKIDEAKAFQATWHAAGDVIGVRSPIPLLRKLKSAKTLTVRIPFFHDSSQDINFTISGLDKHISKMQSVCHWK